MCMGFFIGNFPFYRFGPEGFFDISACFGDIRHERP